MAVEISSALLLRIMRLVAVAGPDYRPGGDPHHEWCGILRGRREDGHERVTRADHAANVAADPSCTFEIDPAALIAAYRAERRRAGPAVLGFFPTHPDGPAVPSIRDAEAAAPYGKLWGIGGRGGVLVWRAVADGAMHGRFDRVIFDLRTGSRVETGCPGVQWRGLGIERSVRFDLEARGQV